MPAAAAAAAARRGRGVKLSLVAWVL